MTATDFNLTFFMNFEKHFPSQKKKKKIARKLHKPIYDKGTTFIARAKNIIIYYFSETLKNITGIENKPNQSSIKIDSTKKIT